MKQNIDPAGLAFHDDDATIAAALEEASIPTLMMSMVHMTGDTSLLDGDLRPLGVYINEYQGFMPPEQQAQVRAMALEVIKAFRDGGCILPAPPSPETVHKMMEFLVAEAVSSDYVPMMLEEMELDGEDARHIDFDDIAGREDFPVLIIGAGMSGILAAIRLQEAGIAYTIIEKNPGVGGTWFENSYPGARVDVGNHLYCYSFEPSYDWSEYFARQPELQAYFDGVAERYDLKQQTQFNTEVVAAIYNEASQTWDVTVREQSGAEKTLSARALISGVGQLNRPKMPQIEGIDSYQGASFHSAQWNHQVDLKGKRVAVIGTGASAFQLVPEVAKAAGQVFVFQRSAPWMFGNELYHAKVGEGKKWCLRHLPYYARWLRFLMFWPAVDGALPAVEVDPDWPHQDRSVSEVNDMVRQMFTDYITEQVGDDKELLAHCIPTFPAMGKRTLQDNGSWLQALKRDNVTLVTDAISHISPFGVSTSEADVAVDVIVYATGFEANRFLYPMDIVGKGGIKLADIWAQEPEAYLGITVPDFPNLFCLFGPATNLAFGGSLIFNAECQMRYVMGCLKMLLQSGGGSMNCKQQVCDEFNQRMRQRHSELVWEHEGINLGFYRNARGHASILWPFKILEMWQWTREPDASDYTITSPPEKV